MEKTLDGCAVQVILRHVASSLCLSHPHQNQTPVSFCACPKACATSSLHQFYDSKNVERIGSYNLAVMEKNSVYRLDDILHHNGNYFRRDGVSILCDAAFRGTLLRSVLQNTTRIHGRPLEAYGLAEQDLESMVSSTGEVGGSGYALASGLTGPSGIEFASEEEQLEKFYYEMRALRDLGHCDTSAPDELLVPLRLGDLTSDVESVRKHIDGTLGQPGCRGQLRKAVVMGVLHYGFNVSAERSYFTTHVAHTRKLLGFHPCAPSRYKKTAKGRRKYCFRGQTGDRYSVLSLVWALFANTPET